MDAQAQAGPLTAERVPDAFTQLVPRAFALTHAVISQGIGVDGQHDLVVAPDSQRWAVWNCRVRLGGASVRHAERPAINRCINTAWEHREAATGAPAMPTIGSHAVATAQPAAAPSAASPPSQDLLDHPDKAPVIRLVDQLLFHAIQVGASDIHIHPSDGRVLVRQRIDGVLDPGRVLPSDVLRPLVSRIKVMGRMDVAERLIPQDGRTSVRIGDRLIDIRISTIPTAFGERVVLRLLDTTRQLIAITDLGMPPAIQEPFLAAVGRSSGIVLVTGPTGSGKTTTLYATLRATQTETRNVMTIEDPIEYELSSLGMAISQSQVNTRKGVNFANGLRHILRQDPDVIMVGEIRDGETARLAIQASLTGHLVLSTLHTNDAISALPRLIDLGVEPYLVGASLSAVLAQRLVRTTCARCNGAGHDCQACHGTGCRGRTGIFELIQIDEAMRSQISQGVTTDALRATLPSRGFRAMVAHGADLVAAGRTTAVEVDRVVHHG